MNESFIKYYVNGDEEDDYELDDSIFTHLEKMHSACEGNGFYKSKASLHK